MRHAEERIDWSQGIRPPGTWFVASGRSRRLRLSSLAHWRNGAWRYLARARGVR